jgi:hypothetical protein
MVKKLLLFILLFSGSAVFSQGLQNVKEPVFKVGEYLNYRLRYGFITAAEASIKVLETDVCLQKAVHPDLLMFFIR